MLRHLSLFLSFYAFISLTLTAQLHNPKHLPYTWKTDTTRKTVDLADLHMSTAPNTIHPLDFPPFITKDDALYNYYPYEPAIVVNFGEEQRAYPLSILTLYELANDSVGGKQVMVTYCPRCNAALVFNRKVKNKAGEKLLHFGVSGMLMHNDMVMYDYETQSWWEQLMGSGIAGDYAGTELKLLPALLISVKDYFDRFPNGKILSPALLDAFRQTHKHRLYAHLEKDDAHLPKFYLPEKVDPRLPPLEHILDIHEDGYDRIYPFHELAKVQVLNENLGGTSVVIFYHGETVSVMDRDDLSKSKKIGSATAFQRTLDNVTYTFGKQGDYFVDNETGSTWDITGYCREGKLQGKQLWTAAHTNHFAFAYLAFYPDAEIYGQEKVVKK